MPPDIPPIPETPWALFIALPMPLMPMPWRPLPMLMAPPKPPRENWARSVGAVAMDAKRRATVMARGQDVWLVFIIPLCWTVSVLVWSLYFEFFLIKL
jgi:hypothetical protein